jgi:hypothetical protein
MNHAASDPCKICGHAFEFHAPDVMTDRNRCWHGACTGDSCEKECKDFVAKET